MTIHGDPRFTAWVEANAERAAARRDALLDIMSESDERFVYYYGEDLASLMREYDRQAPPWINLFFGMRLVYTPPCGVLLSACTFNLPITVKNGESFELVFERESKAFDNWKPCRDIGDEALPC